jgi:glucose/arabinose dehydrogenase
MALGLLRLRILEMNRRTRVGPGRLLFLSFLLAACFRLAWAAPGRVDHSMPFEAPTAGWIAEDLPLEIKTPVVTITSLPGRPQVLITAGLGGVIRSLDRSQGNRTNVFLDIQDRVVTGGESGLCSMVFHPGYATNGYFFVYYCLRPEGSTNIYVRLSRFSVDPQNPERALPDSEWPLITQLHRGGLHYAGDMHFGPDGYLYVSLGDEGYAYGWDNAGRWDFNFFSAILRIDPDQRPGGLPPNPHPSVHPGTYLVPPDNPYFNRTNYIIGEENLNFDMRLENLRTEFWAVGFRNPWRMSFDSETGDLYANDVGVSHREEINIVARGRHHGWYWKEGSNPWPFFVPKSGLADPIYEYEHTEARVAITGSHMYRDPRQPELDGKYLFADWTGQIYAMPRLQDGRYGPPEMLAFVENIATIAKDPLDGSVLLGGAVLQRLVRVTNTVVLPRMLSETGLFDSTAALEPVDGLLGYEVNQPFWSDNAIKRRWFGLPEGTRKIEFSATGNWNSPVGTVWVKHFDFPISEVDPELLRRLETRVIVRTEQGVYGVTYRWNAAGTDAELVGASGAEEDLIIETPSGNRIQRWRYPSRTECLTCHTAVGGHALSFNVAQLNRPGTEGTNQLLALLDAGYFEGNPVIRPNLLPAHPKLDDETVSLEHRVRSYLGVNCSYCHQPGSGNRSPWDGRPTTSLADASIVGHVAIHQASTGYQIFATNIVEAGSTEGSIMFRRLSEFGPLHMPPLGTTVMNTQAISLLGRWITNSLPQRASFTNWVAQHLSTGDYKDREPSADPDQDGDSNEHEFLVGTLPQDPADRWRFRVVASQAKGPFVAFVRKAHRDFRVETAESLDGPWTAIDHPTNRPRWTESDVPAEVPLPDAGTLFVRVRVFSP